MTDKEFFIATLNDELPRFERVLRAVPLDKLEWRPHERSKSAWELVKDALGNESAIISVFLQTGKIDFKAANWPQYATIEDVITGVKKSFESVAALVTQMSDADWQSEAVMMNGEKVEWKTKKGAMAWSFLFDLIHHRGQLSVYLRPMGGKVPSIYGPSADSASM